MNSQKENAKEPDLIKIEWQAPEFEKHKKGVGWFVGVGTIALAIFTVSLIMGNFIFAFMIILAVFAIFIYALKEPRIIKFKINGKGITIDEKLFPYDTLKSFWIFYEPPQLKELSVKSSKWLMPLIKIPIADHSPIEIRQVLIKFLREEKQEESLIDALARYLKF